MKTIKILLALVIVLFPFSNQVEAFTIEKIGTDDYVMPNNPITLDATFWNSYISSSDLSTLRSKLGATEATVITSEQQYVDLVTSKLAESSPGFVVRESVDLAANGYAYDRATNTLTFPSGTKTVLNTAAAFASIPELSTMKNIGDLLESHGKQERALYFRSSSSYSMGYDASANTLTFTSMIVPYIIETIAETEARDLLVDSLAKMIKQNIPNASDKDKAYAIYSYLTRFVTYDLLSNTSSHTGGSLALDYRAVCQSIAYIYNAVGQKLGLNIHYIAGTAGGENHAWNVIELDGKWYYTDATWGTYKNAKSDMDKNDGYVSYNEYFLFSSSKNSSRIPTAASQAFMDNMGVTLNNTPFDSITSYSGLGAGTFGDNMVVYKTNSLQVVDKDTMDVKKTLEIGKVNYSYSKSAVVNNEFYQVFRSVLDKSLLIVVTNLETLETKTLATIPNAKMLSFVSNGLLIEDGESGQSKVVLYSTAQKQQATDKVFQIGIDQSKMYYASDKALVDYGIRSSAIQDRLNGTKTIDTKDYSITDRYETINLEEKEEAEEEITVTNNFNKADVVDFKNLQIGATYKIYKDASKKTKIDEFKATKSSESRSIAQLSDSAGSIYITVTKEDFTESDLTEVKYAAEPKTLPIATSAVTVTNNFKNADLVNFKNLTLGATYKIYKDATKKTKIDEFTATKPSESRSIKQLSDSAGSVYITVKKPDYSESVATKVNYTAEKLPALAAKSVSITNNIASDNLVFKGLTKGYTYTIYSDAALKKKLTDFTATDTAKTITVKQVGAKAGAVYVVVSKSGYSASAATKVTFKAQPTAVLAAKNVTITNNITNDKLAFKGLLKGNTYTVYSDAALKKKLTSFTAKGTTQTLSLKQVGAKAGAVYVVANQPGYLSSAATKVAFKAQPTAALASKYVKVTNTKAKDTIKLSNLQKGTTYVIYNDEKKKTKLASFKPTGSSKTITLKQLGKNAGKIHITAQTPGYNVSALTTVSYSKQK